MGRATPLIAVFIVAICVTSISALKCYICNSATQPNCGRSPPPSEYLLECSSDTLEMLNDFHRSRKLEGVAAPEASQPSSSTEMHTPHSLDEGHDDHFHPDGKATGSSFDSDDKELTLNRTGRATPEPGQNETGPTTPFQTSPMKLPKEATFCRKTSFHIPKQENGENSTLPKSVRIIRTCGWIPEERAEGEPMKTGCKWIGTDGVQMDQCVCTGDGCNSAPSLYSLKAQSLLLTVIMAAGYFYVL